MKEEIRENLKMLEDNLDNLNDYALQFIDKKVLKKLISIWRWYVSHDYFHEKHPQPKGICSKPPLGWLNSQLQGLSVPLHRDIAECIAPVVQSALKTEHAARRIMNRLNMIYGYVSPEDAMKDQQEHRDREAKKQKDRLRAAKARDDRKDNKKKRRDELLDTQGDRLAKKYLADKNKQRKEQAEARRVAEEAAKKRGREMFEQMKREMKERRK
jgi:hypothetical protein